MDPVNLDILSSQRHERNGSRKSPPKQIPFNVILDTFSKTRKDSEDGSQRILDLAHRHEKNGSRKSPPKQIPSNVILDTFSKTRKGSEDGS